MRRAKGAEQLALQQLFASPFGRGDVFEYEHVVAALTTPERLRDDLFVHLPAFGKSAEAAEGGPRAIPLPPEAYVAHPYTLLQTRQVVGRERELELLDDWVANPAGGRTAVRVFCLVAIGGMGKSALTWRWFHERAGAAPWAGRMWWSFYESDAGFDRFVAAALAYVSGRSRAAVDGMSAVDRESELLAALDHSPFLVCLDGLERILIAYANLDFAHLADDELDQRTANHVAGARGLPASAGESFVGQHRLRQTVDARAGNFLRKLARSRASRILVTTRLYPSELQTVTGGELAGSAAWFLRGLEHEDALALWRAMGVSGSDAQLGALFATFDGYPLLIRALAGEVARFRPAPGDFDVWRRAHTSFDPFRLPLTQVKSHVLEQALAGLDDWERDLLHTVAAFRSPTAYETLAALFVQRKGWSSNELDTVLTWLEIAASSVGTEGATVTTCIRSCAVSFGPDSASRNDEQSMARWSLISKLYQRRQRALRPSRRPRRP